MALVWPKAFKQIVDENPHRDAYIFYNEAMEKSSLTREALWNYGTRFADRLKKSGLQRGDIVVCAVPVGVEAAVINVGIWLSGGVVINAMVTGESTELFLHCANKSKAKFVVMRDESFDSTYTAFKSSISDSQTDSLSSNITDSRIPTVKKVLFANRRGTDGFIEKLKKCSSSYLDNSIREEDLAAIYLTSGTTGLPKLVIRSHKCMSIDKDSVLFPPAKYPQLHADKMVYLNVPWSWVAGTTFDVLAGYTRIQHDMWHPINTPGRLYTNIIKTQGVRYAFLTPPELKCMIEYWDVPDKKIADLLVVAGYPVTKQMLAWLLTMVDSVQIRYGCSEIIAISNNYISHVDEFKDFDNGELVKGIEIKAVNENMETLPRGVPGRIMTKSVSVFSGYMGELEKTKEVLLPEDWFLTSDAGYVTKDNHLIINGRYDYVIKHKGQSIYPATVEKPIRECPQVKEVVVVPVANPANHHDVAAFVVRENDSTLTANDVTKLVADSRDVSGNKIMPPQHVLFVDSIEKSDRGKINRNQLIALAEKSI